MRTCLLTTCALAPAPVCSGVLLVCVGLGLGLGLRLKLKLRLRLKLGGGVFGSFLVATLGSVHSTFIELQLLMPQHPIHIPPRPLLFRRYKPTTK